MNIFKTAGKSISIRTHLLAAFAVIVAISLTAVIFSWVSVTNTREKLDVIVSETLPLTSNSLQLDKYAQLFGHYIKEFHGINTAQEHEELTNRLNISLREIERLLTNLEYLKFDSTRIQRIRSQTNLLVDSMNWQNSQFHIFRETNSTLQASVTALRQKQKDFLKTTTPQIDNSYLDFLEKSEKISDEMRNLVSSIRSKPVYSDPSLLDNKVRVAFETLVSSAAGEMRYTLEAVAITYFATGLLYEAASSRDIAQINELETLFKQLLPKIKTIRLILSHSSPEIHGVVISALPIFRFGTDTTTPSIFSLRRQELALREKAAQSAEKAFQLAEELAAAIEDLNRATEQLASTTSQQLHTNLKRAQTVQIFLGISAIVFSLLIIWVYVEKGVIARISHLRKAMESSSRSGEMDIPTSGNDEISSMARALHTFVDQRRSAEQRIRTTLEELNAVLDNIDYGIVFVDKDLTVQLTNRAFLEMWRIRDNSLSTSPSLNQLIDCRICKRVALANGEPIVWHSDNLTGVLCNDDLGAKEIETHEGQFLQHQCFAVGERGKMLTFFDISDLKENQKKLVQAQKTETIGLMAGGVAHDLNNILSGIVSYPDLLLSQLPDESSLKKPIQTIKESGQRAAAVVADLLTITRGPISQKEVANINTLVIEYLNSPEGIQLKEIYPDITINTDLSSTPLYSLCVPVQIKKCLMNIIVNAAEAIEDAGKIVISSGTYPAENSLAVSDDLKETNLMALTIQDNGPGISEEDIEHIFEPFYSRKVMGRSGTGLGLAIVWNTISDHGGTVIVESDGRGTQFHLLLPIIDEMEPQAHKPSSPQDIAGNGEHVLVVDDELLQRDLASRMLLALNYQVTAVASGEEAVKLIKERAFDLIMLDMIMSPGMSGRETYEHILAIRPSQKAIIASGYSSSDDIDRVRALGARESLLKPYTVDQLGQTLKRVLPKA